MGKFLSFAGVLFLLGLLVQPASADSFTDNFLLSGDGYTISFSLPSTLTPSSTEWNGIINIQNVSGVMINGNAWPTMDIQLGPVGYNNYTNYFAIGDKPPVVAIVAPGLFTWNADGTVTINTGTFMLAQWYVGQPYDVTLTVVDPPVSTPEPASLVLLGFGGLTLAALRRRKST